MSDGKWNGESANSGFKGDAGKGEGAAETTGNARAEDVGIGKDSFAGIGEKPLIDDETFLRGVYVKASLLDYDRRENERVRLNRIRLRRQRLRRLASMALSVLLGCVILRFNFSNLVDLLSFSCVLIALGTLLEQAELRWAEDGDEPADMGEEWRIWK